MSRKFSLVSLLFALAAALLVNSGAAAQGLRGKALEQRGAKRAAGSRTARIAVGQGERLEFAGDKSRVMKSMQQALERVKEREVVRDIAIRSFDQKNYLAVRLEDQRKSFSTLFIELVPDSEGSAYHHTGPHVVTCNTVGFACVDFCAIVEPGKHGNTSPFTICRCLTEGDGSTNSDSCRFKINKLYLPQLMDSFNAELLAVGFEESSGEGTATEIGPKDKRPRPKSTP
jgi:hypothetical protein